MGIIEGMLSNVFQLSVLAHILCTMRYEALASPLWHVRACLKSQDQTWISCLMLLCHCVNTATNWIESEAKQSVHALADLP